MGMTRSSETDCRSEEGVTVGLIDAMLTISRILGPRLTTSRYSHAVAEALADFWNDRDMRDVELAATGVIRGTKPVNPRM